MINRRTFLAAAVSAAVLTGCAVGPDYDRPYVPVPKDYRHIQGEEVGLGLLKARWWTEYNDPNLDFFVSKAIANNRTLQQTMANVERAAAQLTVARSNLFPQLNYSGDLGKSKASLNTPTGAAMEISRSKVMKLLPRPLGKSTCGARFGGKLNLLGQL